MAVDKATSFGALTDHFGILAIVKGEGTLGDVLELVDSSGAPRAQDRADAQDENEDVAASAYHGNTAGEIEEISSTYALKSGELDLSDLEIGELSAGLLAENLEVSTGNGEWPQIVVSGFKGLETIVAPTDKTNKFQLPAITVIGAKRAQPLGFTVSGGGRLTGSSISFSCEMAEQQDGLGEPVAHGVSGGTGEVTAEFVKIETAAPAWALATILTLTPFFAEVTQNPGAEEGQAAWHTTSAAAAFIVPRIAAP